MDTIISPNDIVLGLVSRHSAEQLQRVDPDCIGNLEDGVDIKIAQADKKCSRYNFCMNNGTNWLIYNTLYNSLVRLDADEYEKYSALDRADEAFGQACVENGIWVSESVDERANYLIAAELFAKNYKRSLSVTITTTLKCNARCDYCYEAGVVQRDFDENKVEALVDFIKNNAPANAVHLNWFGGEPLLNATMIDRLSARLTEENIKYDAYLITNGSLLDQALLDKLQQWNVSNMQITIDGTEEVYQKRKNYLDPSEGNYYGLLYHVSQAAERGIYIHLRMNIDRNNRENILKLAVELERILGKYENVVFYPAFITGGNAVLKEEEKLEIVYQLMSCIKDVRKLTAATKLYSYPRIHPCMNSDPNSFSIDIDGNVYTCEHHVGRPEQSIGTIGTDFLVHDPRRKQNILRDECRECVFLPKCMGGCTSAYDQGECPCMIEKYIIIAYMRLLLN